MSSLSHNAKVRLTTLMAQFCGPAEAARLVSDEFGVTVDRRTAWKFDASKRGCTTGPRYRQLFHEVRERWLNDIAAIPIANQGHRLRVLDRLANRLEQQGDYLGALKAIELAAKEAGGLFSKERQFTVSPKVATVATATDVATRRAELALRLERLMDTQAP